MMKQMTPAEMRDKLNAAGTGKKEFLEKQIK